MKFDNIPGCTNVGSAGFASFQQKNVKILQYLPQKESWKEVTVCVGKLLIYFLFDYYWGISMSYLDTQY